jgi:tetratricopeptide (TPR) repeat protein
LSIYQQQEKPLMTTASQRKLAVTHAKSGSLCHQLGQFQEAIAHYQKAIALQDDFVAAHWNLGSIFQQQGDLASALSHQLQALAIQPDLLTPAQHYQMGQGLSQSGDLDEAIVCFRRAIQQKPDYIEAIADLGATLTKQGDLNASIACWKQLIGIQPNLAAAHYNLGITLRLQEHFAEAVTSLQQANNLQPDLAAAHFSLGDLLVQLGDLETAIAHLKTAIQIQPNYAQAYSSLGFALSKQHQLDEAVAMFDRAIAIAPDLAEAHCNLADVLIQQEKTDAAIAACQRAITLKPNLAEAHSNLGVALMRQGQLEEAIAACQRAIALKPNLAEAHCNLGETLFKQDRIEAAIVAYHQAIALKPDLGNAHCNLGVALCEQNRIPEALSHLHTAVSLDPDDAIAHINLGMTQILIGDFENGLSEYEWRWQHKDIPKLNFSQPLWDGSALDGRRILIWAEQGFGDTVQFIRYAPMLDQMGGRAIVRCPASLVRLIASMPSVELAIAEGEPLPEYDVHVQMLSLPKLLETTVANIPAQVPYIQSDIWQCAAIAKNSLPLDALNVGIVWASGYRDQPDALRFYHKKSCPLSEFMRLLDIPQVQLYSLQVGGNANDIDEFIGCDRLHNWSPFIHDFTDTAALVAQLDLVIAVDTAIVHLAGAMGKPVWNLLPFAPDWRWFLEREDTPWYPTMRLFRQSERGNWEEVIKRVGAALRSFQKTLNN